MYNTWGLIHSGLEDLDMSSKMIRDVNIKDVSICVWVRELL
jgi:hypothetical protein